MISLSGAFGKTLLGFGIFCFGCILFWLCRWFTENGLFSSRNITQKQCIYLKTKSMICLCKHFVCTVIPFADIEMGSGNISELKKMLRLFRVIFREVNYIR